MQISRRSFIQKSGIALATGIIAPNWLTRLLHQNTGNMQLLRRNVGVFTERGGTIGWLIEKNGIVVVDTQFPEQAEHLIENIKEQSDHKIDLVMNTHHHGDHSGGNIAFKGLADKVVAHANSKANQARQAKERNREDRQLYPDTTFNDNWSQKVGSEVVTATYFGPAHTNGDVVIHFENANVAHLGDLMFNRRFPFIDKSSGASIKNWISVLQQIRSKYDDETMFIFGHAADGYQITGNKVDITAFEGYLTNLLTFVESELKAGKPQEDILALETFPGVGEWGGRGIQRSFSAAVIELTEEN